MTAFELIALIVTAIGVLSFATIFTILYLSYAESTISEYDVGKRDIDLIDESIFDAQASIRQRKKALSIIKRVILYVFVAIAIPFLVFALYSKFTSGLAMIGGKGIIVVASGSMSERHKANTYLDTYQLNNQFNTYDVIVLEEVQEGEIKQYDVIAYVNNEGVNIIHRVVGFTGEGKFITRGDSNNQDDSYNSTYADVLGRYTGVRIPYVGMFVMFLQSYAGLVTIAAIIYCLIMIDRVTDRIHLAQERRLEMLSKIFDFTKYVDGDTDNICSEFTETLYFKNYAYTFNEDGYVGKVALTDDEMQEKYDLAVYREKVRAGKVDTEEDKSVENDFDEPTKKGKQPKGKQPKGEQLNDEQSENCNQQELEEKTDEENYFFGGSSDNSNKGSGSIGDNAEGEEQNNNQYFNEEQSSYFNNNDNPEEDGD
ncbi:MAG: signal peptidase I [Clostridia bacterium]|nr:signal peptidase I [Clostridia bacterium]